MLVENPLEPEKLFLNEEFIKTFEAVSDSVMSMASEDATPEDLLVGFSIAAYMYWKERADIDEIKEACQMVLFIYHTNTDKRLNEWAMKLRLR